MGLTVCYSFRLFYFVLCGDINFVPSYSMVETSYNTMFGVNDLLIISTFGGGSVLWLICPTPSVICLSFYLSFLLCGVYGWLTWL
jgi:hypothetical protein